MIMLDMLVCVGGAVVCVGGAIWNNVHSLIQSLDIRVAVDYCMQEKFSTHSTLECI